MEKKKKVLIVGSSAKEYALAKYFAEDSGIDVVYVAPGNAACDKFAQRVDIRENAVSELLEFAIKNDVDLTIASSSDAIAADIVSDFRENSQQIFAPDAASSHFAISRSAAKKFLYKLHIPIPKFGVFEKQQLASDYLKTVSYPQLITSDSDSENSIRAVCSTVDIASSCINDIYFQDYNKVVLEDYIYGHPFTFYVITDGYQALPLSVVGDYKFREDGDAGLFTLGMGAYVPDYKISFDLVDHLMGNVVYPILNSLQGRETPYLGILGIECVLKPDETYSVTGVTSFLKDHDAQAVINSLDINLYSLMEACATGAFADDYEYIPLNNSCSVAVVLYSRKEGAVISGLNLLDDVEITHFGTVENEFFETLANKGRTLVITQSAATISRAKELLYSNIDEISFDGMKYRRDICAE